MRSVNLSWTEQMTGNLLWTKWKQIARIGISQLIYINLYIDGMKRAHYSISLNWKKAIIITVDCMSRIGHIRIEIIDARE